MYRVRRAAQPYALLFVLLLVVYHSNLRPIAAGDSLPASLIPFSILLDGSITLDRFGPYLTEHVWYGPEVLHKVGGHWYSWYPVAGPVLATPLYLPIALVPQLAKQPPATLIAIARIGEKFTSVTLAAAAAVALLFLLSRLTSRRAAWILTLVFALGTGNWSTASQALWQPTFGDLALIGFLYSMERLDGGTLSPRWYWAAGSFAGIALAIRPTCGILVPVLAVVLWFRSARVSEYLAALVPCLVIASATAAYNLTVFGRLAGGYSAKVERHFVDGLLGILISPGRGLLIYTPVAIFALAAFAPAARQSRGQHRSVVAAATAFSVLHLGLIAVWPEWWGGYCWGPRLLTETLAPILVLIAIGLPVIRSRGWQSAFACLAIYGCLVQALGVYCYPKGRWDALPESVDAAPARVWDWADNPLVRTARGGFVWEPYAIAGAAISGGRPAAAKRLQQLGINPY